ncbi:MAG: 2-C-methyl-D-erythritol 4-phosphate cytidylyltransferase [Ilumatobacteraceae bacterium]
MTDVADAGPAGRLPEAPQPVLATVWTIVVGAGGGTRFGARKQYESLGDGRVLDRAAAVATRASAQVVVVVPAADVGREGGVAGGTTRSESVRAGLAAIPDDADIVCVHDAARPLASARLFDVVIAAVRAGADAAVPAVAVTDTIKLVDGDGVVVETPDRTRLVAVQTPQAFRADVLRRAHAAGAEGTDDATLVELAGGVVVTVPGEASNRKITTPEDLEWARRWVLEDGSA